MDRKDFQNEVANGSSVADSRIHTCIPTSSKNAHRTYNTLNHIVALKAELLKKRPFGDVLNYHLTTELVVSVVFGMMFNIYVLSG